MTDPCIIDPEQVAEDEEDVDPEFQTDDEIDLSEIAALLGELVAEEEEE